MENSHQISAATASYMRPTRPRTILKFFPLNKHCVLPRFLPKGNQKFLEHHVDHNYKLVRVKFSINPK